MQTRPFPTDPRLTGIAIAYRNAEFIADRILPRVPVGKREFRWHKFDRAERMTVPETLVGRKSRPNEVDFSVAEEAGMVYDRGLDDVVPNDDIAEAEGTGYNPRDEAVEGTTELILLDREIRTAAKVLNPANYPAANQVTVTEKWDDPDSNPVALIRDALAALWYRPNVIVMPLLVWNALSNHPRVIAASQPSGKTEGFATRQQLAALLEVDEIEVGASWKNSAKPGQDAQAQRVWGGDTVLAFYRNPQATPRRGVTFGYTAQWGTRVSGQMPEPMIGLRGGIRIRVGESVNEMIVCNDLGYLFKDVLST